MLATTCSRTSITALLLGIIAISFIMPALGSPAYAMEISKLGARQDVPIPEALRKFPAGPLNMFLRMISTLPQGSAALDASARILTPLQAELAQAANIETTQDDLVQNAPCADMTLIFARGTTEPGNVGLVTGPPFIDALNQQKRTASLSVQGVEYPASFAGFNRNGSEGVPSM
jgi:cutinase